MEAKHPNRLVPILGLYGIGKSTLSRKMLQFVASRKYFTGGIIFVQLSNVTTMFTVLKLIKSEFMT